MQRNFEKTQAMLFKNTSSVNGSTDVIPGGSFISRIPVRFAGLMNMVGSLGQVVSIPLVAWNARCLAGDARSTQLGKVTWYFKATSGMLTPGPGCRPCFMRPAPYRNSGI